MLKSADKCAATERVIQKAEQCVEEVMQGRNASQLVEQIKMAGSVPENVLLRESKNKQTMHPNRDREAGCGKQLLGMKVGKYARCVEKELQGCVDRRRENIAGDVEMDQ